SDDINQTETQENKIATIIEKIKSMTAKILPAANTYS
ncbi:hypothetical protein MHK_007761, partial [Candidatus Magnetomorum sp. HK-1]